MKIDDTLTDDKLLEYGFKVNGTDILDRPIYTIEVPKDAKFGFYAFNIQIILSPQYKNDNPNCGVVSIYSPETEASGIPPDLYSKEEWTPSDTERAANYKIKLKAWTQPIAWFVNTCSRLELIYEGLTGTKLEKYNIWKTK